MCIDVYCTGKRRLQYLCGGVYPLFRRKLPDVVGKKKRVKIINFVKKT